MLLRKMCRKARMIMKGAHDKNEVLTIDNTETLRKLLKIKKKVC